MKKLTLKLIAALIFLSAISGCSVEYREHHHRYHHEHYDHDHHGHDHDDHDDR